MGWGACGGGWGVGWGVGGVVGVCVLGVVGCVVLCVVCVGWGVWGWGCWGVCGCGVGRVLGRLWGSFPEEKVEWHYVVGEPCWTASVGGG